MSSTAPFEWISESDVEQRVTYPKLFDAIERAFCESPSAIPRVSLPYQGQTPCSGGTLLLMSAIQPDTLGCVKVVTYNVERSTGIIKYVYMAFDPVSGAVVALIDGEALNTRRTAAVSVVASRYLAVENPVRIVVVGTGPVARELLKAYAASYPDAHLVLWGRRASAVQHIVDEFSAGSMRVTGVTSLDQAVREADIVSCATGSAQPLIRGDLLRPGAHLDLIGGFTPAMREADDDVYRRAALVVVDNVSAITESGDLCQPIADGILPKDRILTLEMLVATRGARRRTGAELTVFKSVGNSVFDLAAARVAVGRSQ